MRRAAGQRIRRIDLERPLRLLGVQASRLQHPGAAPHVPAVQVALGLQQRTPAACGTRRSRGDPSRFGAPSSSAASATPRSHSLRCALADRFPERRDAGQQASRADGSDHRNLARQDALARADPPAAALTSVGPARDAGRRWRRAPPQPPTRPPPTLTQSTSASRRPTLLNWCGRWLMKRKLSPGRSRKVRPSIVSETSPRSTYPASSPSWL
jgi:hypothetical protein